MKPHPSYAGNCISAACGCEIKRETHPQRNSKDTIQTVALFIYFFHVSVALPLWKSLNHRWPSILLKPEIRLCPMTFVLMHRCAIDGNRTASGNKLKCHPCQRWAPLHSVPKAGWRAISRTIPDKTLTLHSHTATHQQGQWWQEQLHIQNGEWINGGW